jgi:glycosyltransferase involved in cell wall biosynthesis
MLSRTAIVEMARSGLFEFGAHSVSHAILSLLSPTECRDQVERAVAAVGDWTGRPCTLFAYPNGRAEDYNGETIKALEACGVRIAVTAVEGLNDQATPVMELRRCGIGAGYSMAKFKRLVQAQQEPLSSVAGWTGWDMPELTVSMPAYNTGRYIGAAIRSVLRQKGVELELIVVDDGSSDNTAQVVRSFNNPRIRLIQNQRRMGIGFCHNVVIRESASPFIAHVDSDDLLVGSSALAKVVSKLKSSSRLGQVHCHFFDIDADGRATRDAIRERREDFLRSRTPDMDYRRELLLRGSIINHLRTYRRQALEDVGGFNEQLRHGEDYEMALRIADQYDIGLLPEFLYAYRIHRANTSESLRFKRLRFWWQRYRSARDLVRSGSIRFPSRDEYNLNWLMLIGLGNALGLGEALSSVRDILCVPRRALAFARWEVLAPLMRHLYALAVQHLSWWPLDWRRPAEGKGGKEEKRIAYYLWRFPSLSETFVQREVRALKEAGLAVQVVADAAQDVELLGQEARSLMAETHYLEPFKEELLRQYKRHFLRRNPLRYLSLFLYVVFHRYTRTKTFVEDREVFDKAVYLAGVLRDREINRLHSPWADRCAFVALLASRLLGVPFSVQGRAHDLHRATHQYGLRETLRNASFVVTNTRYNESYIRTFLIQPNSESIHVIHNGVDLARFVPSPHMGSRSQPTVLLTVARLIQEKGLLYLLQACRILKDKGLSFRCQIIGGPEEPLYADYYVRLKKLHRELRLEDDVLFLGAQPFARVLAEYGNADIFVLPCVIAKNGGRDITPNSLIEAMAMKLPVVSTVLSGIPEIVEDGVSGILVPPNDEQGLADALSRLMLDQELRRTLGENARRRVEERFDIKKNIRQYVGLFKGQGS